MAHSKSGLIAKRYAAVLLDMAAEGKVLDKVERDLHELSVMVKGSPDLQRLVLNPLINRVQQKRAVEALGQSAKFDKLTVNFLGVLVHNRRLSALQAMIEAFHAASAVRRGEVAARVQTAYALTPAQTDALQKELSKALGSNVTLNVEVAKDLLGGMIVTVGSRMVDDSLKRKLERLKRTLSGSQAA